MKVIVFWTIPSEGREQAEAKQAEITWPISIELPRVGDELALTSDTVDEVLTVKKRAWDVTGGKRLETIVLELWAEPI